MDWEKYFEMLIDWKKFPFYRFELRLDSIIGYYLSDFISDHKGNKITDIIPEFLMITDDSFFFVDFLLISNANTNYLIEIKTDLKSRNKKQDRNLDGVKNKKFETLINEIVSKYYWAPKNKNKHKFFINRLKELELINENYEFSGKNNDVEIIFVQPLKDENTEYTIIDFEEISKWIMDKQNNNLFETELCKTLLKIKEEEDLKRKKRKHRVGKVNSHENSL
jgi:hypothetical protein